MGKGHCVQREWHTQKQAGLSWPVVSRGVLREELRVHEGTVEWKPEMYHKLGSSHGWLCMGG